MYFNKEVSLFGILTLIKYLLFSLLKERVSVSKLKLDYVASKTYLIKKKVLKSAKI